MVTINIASLCSINYQLISLPFTLHDLGSLSKDFLLITHAINQISVLFPFLSVQESVCKVG